MMLTRAALRWLPLCPAILLLAVAACTGEPDVPHIVVDGAFEEWHDVPTSVDDAGDAAAESAVDLQAVQVLDDPRSLYFTFETERPINAQAALGTIVVALDADGDPATGAVRYGLSGADLLVALSRVPDGRQFGEGMAIYPVDGEDGSRAPISANVLDLIVAPTHSASRFEARVARGRVVDTDGLPLLVGDSMRMALAFVDQSGERDRTPPLVHRFQTAAVYGPPIRWNQSLNALRGTTRVVQWNVASDRFRSVPGAFARVLGALEPDIVLLDEVYGDVSPAALDDFFALPPLAENGPWQVVLGTTGGRQKSVVASRLPIRPEASMLSLHYSPDSLSALAQAFPDSQVVRLLELERNRGLSAAAAWVSVEGQEVLFAAVDLQSRGYDGSPQDRLREVQASAIREAAAAAAGDGRIVIGGDLNLVGSSRPLERLARELDAGADLQPAPARRFLDASYATWRSQTAVDFTPGQLDFILVPESALEIARAFVFDAADLTDRLRESLSLRADDNLVTSDHLPVVVDLRLRSPREGDR